MTRAVLLAITAVLVIVGTATAEYLEVPASEIASIKDGSRTGTTRILVKWSLPDSLPSLVIDGAAVTMTLARDSNCSMEVSVYPVTRAWSSTTVGWDAGWSRAGGDFNDSLPAAAVVNRLTGGKISANVYDIVLDHLAGRRANFGFIVVPDSHSSCPMAEIAANDAGRLADAKLVIAYRHAR